MILRFREVVDGLYRGSAPSPGDVETLKEDFGIKRIVSLDEESALRIDRVCKLLDIQHVVIPIGFPNVIGDIVEFLKHDLEELFLKGGPVFVHCLHGKDRTGFAMAVLEVKYLGKKPEDAIEEAKALGFGLGVSPAIVSLFEKFIKHSAPSKDSNEADIVSNEREYIGDNRDSFLDEGHQGSFAPYLSQTKQNPMDALYNFVNEQSPTRQNYESSKSIKEHPSEEENVVPMVGVFNNDAGGRGFGPTENAGGFIYD